MTTINPYFSFWGNTEEIFLFYKSVFGGEFADLQRFKDVPSCENLSAEEQKKSCTLLTDGRQVKKSKCQYKTPFGMRTLAISPTNLVSNGW